jgi:hypothetical protein
VLLAQVKADADGSFEPGANVRFRRAYLGLFSSFGDVKSTQSTNCTAIFACARWNGIFDRLGRSGRMT